MKSLQIAALVTFGLGLALLVAGYTFRGDSSPTDVAPEDTATPQNVQATPTNTRPPSATPSATSTNVPPPTATPTPFDGTVSAIHIDRFEVNSAIEEIGLTPNNELDVPHDPNNTGWYSIYDRPGWGGNAVFSAHVDYYPDILGPFNRLAELELNDEIGIEMADGTTYRYRVVSNRRFSVYTIKMGELIWPETKPADAEWITLITCGGEFVSSRPGGPGEYLDRDVVVAERIH